MKNIISYLATLMVSQGQGAGEPLQLYPWERKFIRGAFATDGDSALSVARGNGKSTLLGAIGAAFVDGPLRQPRAEMIIVASSFAQARIVFEHAKAFISDKIDDKQTWRVSDSDQSATITHRPTGARLRAVGNDPRKMHGWAPWLVCVDEPAQHDPSKTDRALAAIRTAMGKVPGSRMVAIGTKPENPGHWFSAMLSGGAAYSQSHAADPTDNPFRVRTWHRANPSLRYMPALRKRIEAEAKEAKTDPSMLASFRALRLNLGTSDTLQSHLLDARDWQRIEGDAPRNGPFCLGVDLGTNSAMSALAAYWPETKRLEAIACFPQKPSLAERGLADGCGKLYSDMFERGELIVRGNRVSDVRGLLEEGRARWGFPIAISCDRWREAELRDELEDAGYPIARLDVRGQGFKDGGEDVRDFRGACLGGRVTPVKSLLLTSSMSEARVSTDPAGNAKLSKGVEGGRRMRAKDDAVAASILAVACGVRLWRNEQPTERGVYLGKV